MGEWDKHYEDSWYEGEFNTGVTNSPSTNPWHKLPFAWENFGPVNMPNHLWANHWNKNASNDYMPTDEAPPDQTGIFMAYLTIDTSEHAFRFIKDLFRIGLCADAYFEESGVDRSYLKLGKLATNPDRVRVQLTLAESRVVPLIDYINQNNPSTYDYPVQDTIVVPIKTGDPDYIQWVIESAKKKIDYNAVYGNNIAS